MGVATFPDDGTDSATLIDAADRALYEAKASGRNAVRASPATAGVGANEADKSS